MPYGRANRAIPDKKVPAGTVISGSMASPDVGGSVLDSAGIIASLDDIGTVIASQAALASAEYIPDSLLRNITIDSGNVLLVEKPERYNDITNNGKIIILSTGQLGIMGSLKNAGTVIIHKEGRLIT